MKKRVIIAFVILSPFVFAEVSLRDTTIQWSTFDYELNQDNTLKWTTSDAEDTVTKKFSGQVLENEYLKVTLLPEYGGRILSMVYKPTGHEQLYRNPVGNPYGQGDGNFYYDWLMVYGGIFPTLPEPEHGKAWLLPWGYEVIKNTPDTVKISMSWQDTVGLGEVAKFGYGKTNLKCDFEVKLVKGESALSTDITVKNVQGQNIDYEYWTCLTLAPGSSPSNPKTKGNTKMIMPYSKIEIKPWWNLQSVEEPINKNDNIYEFENLKYYKNWVTDGIIYPRKEINKNFWGAINQNNKEGIIRVANNKITPGIKIWGWNYSESQDIKPAKNPDLAKRPYLELWAGHSNEFFQSASIQANSKINWQEIYIPSQGLAEVNKASQDIVANYYLDKKSKEGVIKFVTTYPERDHQIIFKENQQEIKRSTISAKTSVNKVLAKLPKDDNWSEGDSLYCLIKDSEGHKYFQAALSLNNVSTVGVTKRGKADQDYSLSQNYPNPFNSSTTISYNLKHRSKVDITIFDLQGRKIKQLEHSVYSRGKHSVEWRPSVSSGIYYYRIHAKSEKKHYTETKKLVYLK